MKQERAGPASARVWCVAGWSLYLDRLAIRFRLLESDNLAAKAHTNGTNWSKRATYSILCIRPFVGTRSNKPNPAESMDLRFEKNDLVCRIVRNEFRKKRAACRMFVERQPPTEIGSKADVRLF